MDLAYFVVLIGSLIFVHELGHFLVAKAFGVKVITFSLGFGPKVLRFNGRETEYCLSLLPLGGYVKMLEESRSDLVLPEDRKRTLESLALYKRVLIVLAGPAMNLVFPILLYFSVFVTDGPFAPPTVGMVLPGRPADGVLLPGDRIMSINGQEVGTFDEVRRLVEKSPRKLLKLQVFRDSRHERVDVIVQEQRRALELDLTERFGSIGIQPNMPAPVIGVTGPDTPAFRAGLRTFDRITFIAGRPVHRFRDIELELASNRGETVPITYLRPTRVPGALGNLVDLAVFEAGVVAFTPGATDLPFQERTGMESVDLYAAVVPVGSYLYKAGLREGDRLKKLDDELLPAWSTFVDLLADAPDTEHKLTFISMRDGVERSGTFQVRREDFVGPQGERFHRYLLPCGSWANRMETGTPGCAPGSIQQWLPLALEERVEHPTPIRYAFEKAIEETWSVTRLVSLTFVRLVQTRASLEDLTGPIGIYEIAGRERRKGAEYFIWVMALLSINLGLLNLLPIPVLDGGHLLFFGVEAVIRRALPMRIRELAHILGMAMLVFLMGVAFKNDVDRRSEARELDFQEGQNGAR
jgi:regulator of sigma E protease